VTMTQRPHYRVTFQVVGRTRTLDPLEAEASTPDELAKAVHGYVRPMLASREVEVLLSLGTMTGRIDVGGRTIGRFKIEELPREKPVEHCRRAGCGARILWLGNNNTHNPAPIDAEPSDNGNIRVDRPGGIYEVLSPDRAAAHRVAGVALHVNHFYTCKNPPQRGGKR
jgi:hypothetical protein